MPDDIQNNGVSMFNKQTGAVELVPYEAAAQAFESGNYGVDPSQEFMAVSPTGSKFAVKGNELGKIFQYGARLETADERLQREQGEANQARENELETKYGNSPVKATALGLARGLTARLSDVALVKSGLVEPETIKEIADRNPEATAAEVVGTVAPLVFTMGGSALGQGATKAAAAGGAALAAEQAAAQSVSRGTLAVASKLNAPFLLNKMGELATKGTSALLEKGISKVLKREAEEMAAKVLIGEGVTKAASKSVARMIIEQTIPRAVGGAVEGAAYGAANLLSEDALGDAEFNAENLISSVGMGALLGGGVAGAMTLPGIAWDKTGARLFRQIGKKAEQEGAELTVENALDLDGKLSATGTAEGAAKSTTKVKSKISFLDDIKPSEQAEEIAKINGKDPRLVERFLKRKDAAMAQPHWDSLPETVMDGLKNLDDKIDNFESQAEEIIAKSNKTFSSKEIADYIRDDIKAISKTGYTESGSAAVRRLNKYLHGDEGMFGLVKTGDDGANVYRKMTAEDTRQFVRNLRKDIKQFFNQQGGGSVDIDDDAIYRLSKFVDTNLKNQVDGYAEVMKPYAKAMDAKKTFLKEFKSDTNLKNKFTKALEYEMENYQKPVAALTDKPSLRQPLRSPLAAIKKFGQETGIDFSEWYQDRMMMTELFPQNATGSERGSLTWQLAKNMGGLIMNPVGKTKEMLTNAVEAGMKNALSKATMDQTVETTLWNNVKQKAAADMMLGATSKTGATVKFLANMERVGKSQIQHMGEMIGNILDGESKVGTATRGLAIKALAQDMFAKDEKKTTYQATKEKLAELGANPQNLMNVLDKHSGGLMEVAPKITSAMQQSAVRAVQYLNAKMPRSQQQGFAGKQKDDYEPSPYEMSSFEKRLRAIQQPLSVLHDAVHGQLTPEAVDALKTVYPKMYQAIKMQTIAQMAQKESILYDAKIQLSMLFQVPLDETMQPDFVRSMQASYATSAADPQQGGGAPPQQAMKMMSTRSRSFETESQRLAGRGL